MNNIQVTNSELGVLNTGNIQNVDSTVTVLKTSGNSELAETITQLSETVIKSNISNDIKNQIIELLDAISTEAVAPQDKRRKSVVGALLAKLSAIMSNVECFSELWQKAKSVFENIFGI